MAGASAKDIQDLSKSIHQLIKTVGMGSSSSSSSSSKSKTKDTSTPDSAPQYSEKQILAGFAGLEQQEKTIERINALSSRRNEIDKKAAELADSLAKNQKSYGTDLFKNVELTGDIKALSEDIYDTAEKLTKAKKSNNTEEAKLLKKTLAKLKATRNTLKSGEDELKQQQKLNKAAGERLKAFKSITDAIKNPLKAFEKLGSSMEESIGKRFNASLAAPKKSIMEIATSGIKLGIVAGIGLGVKRAMHLNQELVDMQRSLGVTSHEAHDIHTSLQDAAMASKVLGANQKDYNDAFNALSSTMGTNVANQQKILDSQVLLTKQFGMSNDEAKEFQMTSIGTGKSAEENLMQIKDTVTAYNEYSEDSLSVREIQQDIAKSSKSTLANYKGDVRALTAAVIQAKKLGMTMAETEGVANNLLDFESSIEAEMKASVMTGQHINMNKARELALMGDTAGAAAEALKQAGSFDKFQKMDVLQKKAVAEAAGMTVEQIMKAGQLEKMNSMFGVKSLKNLSKAEQQRLVTQKIMSQEEIDKGIRDEQAASAQEKMNTMIDKMYTLFDQVASGPIESLVSGLGKAFEFMGKMVGGIKKFVKTFMPEKTGGIMKAAVGIGVGTVAVIAAFKKVKEFFGAKLGEKGNPTHTIVDNLKGGGIGGGSDEGAGGDADEEGGGIGSKVKKGLKGAKRLFKAFKKGGFKGLKKAAGRMAKSGIKGALGMGSGGGAPKAPGAGKIPGGGKSPMDAITSSGQKGASKLTSSAGAVASTGSKVASKGGGFLSKIGGFFSKLNPLKAIKGAFAGPGLKKILGKIPKIGSIISAAMAIHGVAGAAGAAGAGAQDVGKQLVMAIGDMGGTFLGGLLGSIVPGAGTLLGGFLGGMGGSALAGLIADNVDVSGMGKAAIAMFGSKTPDAGPEVAAPDKSLAVKDALIRPGQPPVTFDKGDLIMAGTNLEGGGKSAGGGGGSSEVASLLKQLIAKVDQPVHVNIGGRVMDEIEKQTSLKKTYTTKTDRGYSAFG